MGSGKNWLGWLWPRERRESTRETSLPVNAYYWDGGVPAPRTIRDISSDGMYMETEQRWYPNTLVAITLTRNDRPREDPARALRVTGRVVRSGQDGVGFAFMFAPQKGPHRGAAIEGIDRKAMVEFLDGLRRNDCDQLSAEVWPLLQSATAA